MRDKEAPGRLPPAAASAHGSLAAGECGVKDQVSCPGPPPPGAEAPGARPRGTGSPGTGSPGTGSPGTGRFGCPVALVGPTASGKTALAVRLARALPGFELVSVDAMAVYRGLDVGTAKPSAAERVGLTWHLLDLVGPDEEFSVARFQSAAREAMAGIEARGHRALLVGGTGLYHRAVVDDLELPGRYPEVAAELSGRAAEPGGLAVLHEQLAALDPLAASRILANNERRILRALEVTLGSGRRFSSFGPGLTSYAAGTARFFGVRLDRRELDRRIAERLDAQLASGFLEEATRLASGPLSRTARQALGYRELIEHARGVLGLDEARTLVLRRTRAFARRQEAWFRRDPRVTWLEGSPDEMLARLLAHLGDEPSRCRPAGELPARARSPWETGDVDGGARTGDGWLALTKYEALGNDFLVLVDLEGTSRFDGDLARALCERHTGIGADGLLRLSRAPARPGLPEALRMELLNADGSPAETSGNGLRCAALAALDAGLVPGHEIEIETGAGRCRAVVRRPAGVEDGDHSSAPQVPDGPFSVSVSVSMGTLSVEEVESPVAGRRAFRVDAGNPHLVLVGDSLAGVDLGELGRRLDAATPSGTNVELVASAHGADDSSRIEMLVWERGVGLTLACGSGSVAAAAAAQLARATQPARSSGVTVTVENPGGTLVVELSGRDPHRPAATLTGPARHVAAISVSLRHLPAGPESGPESAHAVGSRP